MILILQYLLSQRKLSVHCKGGSGRTGLVVGLFMHELGYDKADIIGQVQKLRPKALCHPVQLSFFNEFKK